MTEAGKLRVIAIHGAPRSGTSWLGQLFNSSEHVAYRYQPLFSYAFKDSLNERSSTAEIEQFFNDLLNTQDDFVLQRGSASLSGYTLDFPKVGITHLVYKEVRYHNLIEHILENCMRVHLVGLIRDPRAVMHSWLNAPREFGSDWSVLDEWRSAHRKNEGNPENWYGFERWKELAQLFLRLKERFPERVDILRYETLAAAPYDTLRHLYSSCGLPITKQVKQFIAASRERDDGQTYGVFRSSRNTSAAWRQSLDAKIVEEIQEDLGGTELQRFLLNRKSDPA